MSEELRHCVRNDAAPTVEKACRICLAPGGDRISTGLIMQIIPKKRRGESITTSIIVPQFGLQNDISDPDCQGAHSLMRI